MITPQELVACIEKLTSLPAVYHRIRALLDDPDSSVHDLAEAVSSDPAITARVLRVVNSVLFGFPGRIETVGRAVNLLGMQQVHDLVLGTAIVGAFNGIRPARMHMSRFWKDSVYRGLAARAAAHRLGLGDPERLFVEGLLADIGHLVMFQAAPDMADAALERAHRHHIPIHEAEQSVVGCHYAEVGAALASAWHLPAGFSAAIGAQLMPLLAGPHTQEAAILHLANDLLASDADEVDEDAVLATISPSIVTILQADASMLGAVRARVRDELSAVIALFFPDQS